MLKHIDISSAIQRVADRKIEEAIRQGKFDNLPGAGQPIDLDPEPADEDVRLMWWALRILRQNEIIPDEVRYRKAIDSLRQRVSMTRSENELKSLVAQGNELIHKLNTMGTNAIESRVAPIDLHAELAALSARKTYA